MKRIILYTVAILLLSIDSYGQVEGLGVKAGFNFAKLQGTGLGGAPSSRNAFHIGVVYRYALSEKFSLNPELLYSQQGMEESIVLVPGRVEDATFRIDYLNVPILLNFHISSVFRLSAGPQIGYLVHSDLIVNNKQYDFDHVEKLDYSIATGLAFDMDFGLSLEFRYTFGLNDISTEEDDRVWNQVFQFGASYIIFRRK